MKNQTIQQTINTIIKRHINVQPDLLFLKSLLIEQEQKTSNKIAKYKNKYRQAIKTFNNQQSTKRVNSPVLQIRNAKSNQKYVADQKLKNNEKNIIPSNIFMNQFFQQTQTLKGILHKFVHQTNQPILRNKLLSLYKIFASSLDQTQKSYQKQLNRYSTQDIHKNSTKIKQHLLEQLKKQIQKNRLLQQNFNKQLQQKLKNFLSNAEYALIQKDVQIKKLKQTIQDLNKIASQRGVLKQNNLNIKIQSNKANNADIYQNNSKVKISTIQNKQQASQSVINNLPEDSNQFSEIIVPTKIQGQRLSNDKKQQIISMGKQNLQNQKNQSKIQSKVGCFYNANDSINIGKLVADFQQPKKSNEDFKKVYNQKTKQNENQSDIIVQNIQANTKTTDLLHQNNILKNQIKKLQDQQRINQQKLQKAITKNNFLTNQNNQLKNNVKMHSQEYAQLQKEVNYLYNQFQNKQKSQNKDYQRNPQKFKQVFLSNQKNISNRLNDQNQKIKNQRIQHIPAIRKSQAEKHKSQSKNDFISNANNFYTPKKQNKMQIINDLISITENSKRNYVKQSKINSLTLNQTQEDKIIAQAELALSRIDNTEIYNQKPGDFSDLSIIHQKPQRNRSLKSKVQATQNQSYFSVKQKPQIKLQQKIKQNSQKVQKVRFKDDYEKDDQFMRMILIQAITIESKIQNQDYSNQFLRHH